MEEKENFYHELDTHKKRSYCTCQTLLIGLVLIAIGVAAMVAWGVAKVKTAVLPDRQVVSSDQDRQQLEQKVSHLDLRPGASTSLTITERELTSLMVQGVSQNGAIPFRELQAEINPDGIIVSGVATKILNSSLALTILPKVVDGKVRLDVAKIQAGTLTVPSAVTEMLSKQANEALTRELKLESIAVKSVALEEGSMTVTGTVIGISPNP